MGGPQKEAALHSLPFDSLLAELRRWADAAGVDETQRDALLAELTRRSAEAAQLLDMQRALQDLRPDPSREAARLLTLLRDYMIRDGWL